MTFTLRLPYGVYATICVKLKKLLFWQLWFDVGFAFWYWFCDFDIVLWFWHWFWHLTLVLQFAIGFGIFDIGFWNFDILFWIFDIGFLWFDIAFLEFSMEYRLCHFCPLWNAIHLVYTNRSWLQCCYCYSACLQLQTFRLWCPGVVIVAQLLYLKYMHVLVKTSLILLAIPTEASARMCFLLSQAIQLEQQPLLRHF